MENKKYYKLYAVGGCVRDGFLGIKSKDIDFSFEFTQEFIDTVPVNVRTPMFFYTTMNNMLRAQGFEIFLEVPKAFTTKARFPEGHEHAKLTADFVMCRKESYPNPLSRMPKVEVGNLYDDLLRRDFTVNAMAEDEDGKLIDPFNGYKDLKEGILRCPVTATQSFNDDPLRMLRALRFSITKGFTLDKSIRDVIVKDISMWFKFEKVVSDERIREELNKMFKHDTRASFKLLNDLQNDCAYDMMAIILGKRMWFKPTLETK